MTEREKLIELLKSPHKAERLRQMGVDIGAYQDDCIEAMIADFLLANDVIVLLYKPFPLVMSEDEDSADVFCPFCDTNLSGHYYGGDYEPPQIFPCFECGTWLDGTKAITREEAEKALAERSGK